MARPVGEHGVAPWSGHVHPLERRRLTPRSVGPVHHLAHQVEGARLESARALPTANQLSLELAPTMSWTTRSRLEAPRLDRAVDRSHAVFSGEPRPRQLIGEDAHDFHSCGCRLRGRSDRPPGGEIFFVALILIRRRTPIGFPYRAHLAHGDGGADARRSNLCRGIWRMPHSRGAPRCARMPRSRGSTANAEGLLPEASRSAAT